MVGGDRPVGDAIEGTSGSRAARLPAIVCTGPAARMAEVLQALRDRASIQNNVAH